MKFAILSLVAAGALAVSAGSVSAQHYYGGYNSGGFHPVGPHLDYHRGHYHYHDGFYRSGPLYPAYPTYRYPSYNSGFGVTIGGSRGVIIIGSGSNSWYGNSYSQPYYGGGYGRRW